MYEFIKLPTGWRIHWGPLPEDQAGDGPDRPTPAPRAANPAVRIIKFAQTSQSRSRDNRSAGVAA
jgi:hypothetical protein